MKTDIKKKILQYIRKNNLFETNYKITNRNHLYQTDYKSFHWFPLKKNQDYNKLDKVCIVAKTHLRE